MAAAAGLLLAGTLVVVGPWPVYGPGDLERDDRLLRGRRALAASATGLDEGGGRFEAGWARRRLPDTAGRPLAGYAERQGRPSSSPGEDLDVEALVVSDGVDLAAVLASDLLIVPPEVAAETRARVARETPLRGSSILFNASHTHSGPGGFLRGWVGERFAGAYDPGFVSELCEAFAGAIADAWRRLEPARLAHGVIPAHEHVHNRARPAGPVDGALTWLLVEQEDGERLIVSSFPAHATVLPALNRVPHRDYPGFLEDSLERATGAEAFFLAGAVGSMGPSVETEGPPAVRARRLGEALAARVGAAARAARPDLPGDVASAGAAFRMPPLQVRIGTGLRWSPLLARWAGLDDAAWLSLVRIGGLVLLGAPGDLSGETALTIRSAAARRGVSVWTLSFNGAYVGYLSPDRYYDAAPRTRTERYELYTMSWCGPQQEAFLGRLIETGLDSLTRD